MKPFWQKACNRLMTFLLCLFMPASVAYAGMVTQLTPTLTVTEEYKDNYFQTGEGVEDEEEWVTTYELGFSIGFLSKRSQIYLNYNPEYNDYKNLSDRDSLDQNGSLSGTIQATKHTTAKADIVYDGHDGNHDGDSWEHSANASVDSQLTKTVNTSLAYDYSNSFTEQLRTGEYKENTVHNGNVAIRKTFGAKSSMGADCSYETIRYKDSDADEYESYEPTAFLTYWFTRLDAVETNLEYTNKKFDTLSTNDYETYAGDIRYIRQFTKHLDGYIKYRHYLSEREDGDHVIYHPSIGFDWDITEDSGISLGAGVLFDRWDDDTNEDSEEPFFDINAYKVFNFSRKGSLSITGSSSYEESDDEAASLGYTINYQAGFSLNYMIAKRLSSSLFASYKLQDFKEEDVDRQDDTFEVGGGLTWSPLKWLQVRANVSHVDFKTDDALRHDYEENTVTVFVRLIPEKPIRPDKEPSRSSLEKEIF